MTTPIEVPVNSYTSFMSFIWACLQLFSKYKILKCCIHCCDQRISVISTVREANLSTSKANMSSSTVKQSLTCVAAHIRCSVNSQTSNARSAAEVQRSIVSEWKRTIRWKTIQPNINILVLRTQIIEHLFQSKCHGSVWPYSV